MAEAEESWDRLIHGLREGDPQVMREFCDRYGERLHRLAEKRLGGKLARRVGPEDVVQSAYRTFLRRARGGEYHLDDSDSLWRLLCAITLNKLYQKARDHQRHKRSYDREVPLNLDAAGESGFHDPVDPGPAPDEEAAFADQFEKVLAVLDPEERQVVELKLQGCTHQETAERMGSSERTVRRLVKRIQRLFEGAFEGG
jgi:RNA polymerase sigma-70 factor (ECF subfamily)